MQKFLELLKLLSTKRMIIVTLLGFSSGLPIMVIYRTIKLWLRREGVDLGSIGLISSIALPYTFNFTWAFVLDRVTVFKTFGKRKSWILLTQLGLSVLFFALSFYQPGPGKANIMIALLGFLLCFISATHDVAVDSYRNEILKDEELGPGASFAVFGYKMAMWLITGFFIWIVDVDTWNWTFNQMFRLLALVPLALTVVTFLADEPENYTQKVSNIEDAVIGPFKAFLTQPSAILILLFILFYKFGDAVCGSMLAPYYADLGFSNKIIGETNAAVSWLSSVIGMFVGGMMIYNLGYKVGLWVGGILQAISTALFAILAYQSTQLVLGGIIMFEDFSSGIGSAALIALMGKLADKRFTASQYALFASIASFARTFISASAGFLIEAMKKYTFLNVENAAFAQFFILGLFLAIPGLVCLSLLHSRKLKILS